MIKNCTYIKQFTPEQKRLLEALSVELKLKNANDIFLHILSERNDLVNEIARLKRIVAYKQSKIEKLTGEIN